jgi:hypothetical protein
MTLTVDPLVVNWNDPDQGSGNSAWNQGPAGSPGPKGDTGSRGSYWYEGSGPPILTGGVLPNDMYLDVLTGDVYAFS